MKNNKGFTLVEVVVSFSLIMIVMVEVALQQVVLTKAMFLKNYLQMVG